MSLPQSKTKLLRNYVNYICENCHRNEDEVGTLQAHRIRRGNDGGRYILRNILMVCKKCHQLLHGREFK